MSKGGFLERWSRRKRSAEARAAVPEAARPAEPSAPLPRRDMVAEPSPAPEGDRPAGAVEEEVNPATLPPIESLGPDSDYTVFLRKGVPEPLRMAALRRAWMTDPFIRDFRGPAEYAIDYTTSEFDLLPTDDVAKLLARIVPSAPAAADPPSAPPAVAAAEAPPKLEHGKAGGAPLPAPAPPPIAPGETLPSPTGEIVPVRRKHGGALPR